MTTPMSLSKCLRFTNNISLRSLIHLHLNPIATANSPQTISESQSKLRRSEFTNPNSLVQNDVASVLRNQISLAALCGGEMVTRGRAVKIDDEFNEEEVGDESDEFESEEDEDEFDEMDGEDCLDDDDDDEDADPVYKKRK
ncbi:hypothetical protein POM88_005473 [Heracleum sosnowskyi]|uniref:Uncharacterized protein n=1 Tax=Heracleum sosnowskyi TaxID=360622 RepID=A0AAD8MZ61_9APIA|nr:hypothetical protein POM88_005473 [Heracleum sosnowskyi]